MKTNPDLKVSVIKKKEREYVSRRIKGPLEKAVALKSVHGMEKRVIGEVRCICKEG